MSMNPDFIHTENGPGNIAGPLGPLKAVAIFGLATLYFYALLHLALPVIRKLCACNPALHWFITGFFLFIPLFLLSFFFVWTEGSRSVGEALRALNVRPMSGRDWAYAAAASLLAFAATGVVFAASMLLSRYTGSGELSTTPWFMEFRPFTGAERLLLLAWLPMFTFNILGEELLWRGFIQSRLTGKHAWALCGLLWLCFHLPFGTDLVIMAVPVIFILPYAFHKTRNTLVGVFIHAVFNGPIFVLISLGVIGK